MIHQLARVGNVAVGDGPNRLTSDSHDRGGLDGESDKLDLVSLMAGIDVNDCSDVAALKALVGKRCGQDDAIVFVNHGGKLLEGMGGDQAWFVGSAVEGAPQFLHRRGTVLAVPEGRLRIAQHLSAGYAAIQSASPAGTAESSARWGGRPCRDLVLLHR